MTGGEKIAVRFSIAAASANLLFWVALIVVVSSVGILSIVKSVPLSLKLVLLIPDVAALLSLGVAWFAVKAWREGYWRRGRRVHYTLVTMAALFMTTFYYYWNMLGLQFAG